jgi:hypothetical protein
MQRKTYGITAALGLACAIAAAPLAAAQSMSGPSSSEAAGATNGLGASHRFNTADAAAAHCPGDTVVWASGTKYRLSGTADYGKKSGYYACKAEADSAGFSPAS